MRNLFLLLVALAGCGEDPISSFERKGLENKLVGQWAFHDAEGGDLWGITVLENNRFSASLWHADILLRHSEGSWWVGNRGRIRFEIEVSCVWSEDRNEWITWHRRETIRRIKLTGDELNIAEHLDVSHPASGPYVRTGYSEPERPCCK